MGPCGVGWSPDIDDEDHPRNAGAIRTALMLGAEFEQIKGYAGPQWKEKSIVGQWHSRTILAFLFIGRHGLGIDDNGSPHPHSYFQEKLNVPHSSG